MQIVLQEVTLPKFGGNGNGEKWETFNQWGNFKTVLDLEFTDARNGLSKF